MQWWGMGYKRAYLPEKYNEPVKSQTEIDYDRNRSALMKMREGFRKFFRKRRAEYTRQEFSMGPWDIEKCKGLSEYVGSNKHVFPIGTWYDSPYTKHENRWHMNAMLIETAPILFSELKLVLSKYGHHMNEDDVEAIKTALKYATTKGFVEYKG